jgi:hypothetical protein
MGLGVTFRTRSSGGTRTQRQDLRRKRTMMYSASLTIIVMVRGGWRRASEARRLQRQRQRVRARRETPESAYGCRKVDQNWEFKGCTHTQTQTNKHKQTNTHTHTHGHGLRLLPNESWIVLSRSLHTPKICAARTRETAMDCNVSKDKEQSAITTWTSHLILVSLALFILARIESLSS